MRFGWRWRSPAKDIRAELRSRTALLSALVFAALVLVVFNFARDPTALSRDRAGAQRARGSPLRWRRWWR